MRYLVYVAILMMGMTGSSYAIDGAPGSFGDMFNAEAMKINAATRIEIQQCKTLEKTDCLFTGNHFQILAQGSADPAHTSEVYFISKTGMRLFGVDDPEWILMELFSPQFDDVAKSNAKINLGIALDKTDTKPAMVSLVLGQVRYGWIRMPDGTGDAFYVEDPATVSAVPHPAQVAITPAAPPEAPPPTTPPPATEPQTATTKDIVTSFSPTDFKIADPADLFVAPRKFQGKPIEIRHVHCYYADVDDYRCVAPGYDLVAVFMSDIAPPTEKDRLENECGAMKVFMTARCERTLHVVVSDIGHDHVDIRDRVLLKAASATLMPPATPAVPRKRR